MDEEQVTPGGLSRRDIIKRGAVGGAIVWAVPVVSSFSTPAGAQTALTPEEPPNGGGDGDISNAIVAFTCGGTLYVVKVEADGSVENVNSINPGNDCYQGATSEEDGTGLITFERIDDGDGGDPETIIATVSGDCVILEGSAKCDDENCVEGVISGSTITFSGCPHPQA